MSRSRLESKSRCAVGQVYKVWAEDGSSERC
jgi:hypothetical protein